MIRAVLAVIALISAVTLRHVAETYSPHTAWLVFVGFFTGGVCGLLVCLDLIGVPAEKPTNAPIIRRVR